MGLIITVVVTAADTGDRQGLVELLTQYFADGVAAMIQISMIRLLLNRLA